MINDTGEMIENLKIENKKKDQQKLNKEEYERLMDNKEDDD